MTISPAYCDVSVHLRKEKNVSLKLNVSGGPEVEYNSSLELSKNKLMINGEPKIVDGIEFLEVEVDYEKIKNHLDGSESVFDVSGKILYPDGIYSVSGETEVSVTVRVKEKNVTISGDKVLLTGVPTGYTASAEDVTIKLVGLEEEIDSIVKSEALSLSIDLTGADPASAKKSKCSVYINEPFGVVYDESLYVRVEFQSESLA